MGRESIDSASLECDHGPIQGGAIRMKIAAHHVPGTPEHRLSELLRPAPAYVPRYAWPEGCTVQWGHGIVPAVPFFEAFPSGTFIRGEGPDIAAAERSAFEQYQRDLACDHVWGRQRPGGALYVNGAAFCRRCGGFRGTMFPEIRELGWWRRPLSQMEAWHLRSIEDEGAAAERMDGLDPEQRARRERSHRILRLRESVFGEAARPEDA